MCRRYASVNLTICNISLFSSVTKGLTIDNIDNYQDKAFYPAKILLSAIGVKRLVACNIWLIYTVSMNKRPLPIHLLVDIKGFALLGQTSFGGYFKIILSWWLNDCPSVLSSPLEWRSISGMHQRDYNLYAPKIEPVLIKSFEILTKYRDEQEVKSERRRVNLRKALVVRDANTKRRMSEAKTKASLVDQHVPVNPGAIKPPPQKFHEGWNLNKKPAAKPTSCQAGLIDK